MTNNQNTSELPHSTCISLNSFKEAAAWLRGLNDAIQNGTVDVASEAGEKVNKIAVSDDELIVEGGWWERIFHAAEDDSHRKYSVFDSGSIYTELGVVKLYGKDKRIKVVLYATETRVFKLPKVWTEKDEKNPNIPTQNTSL